MRVKRFAAVTALATASMLTPGLTFSASADTVLGWYDTQAACEKAGDAYPRFSCEYLPIGHPHPWALQI